MHNNLKILLALIGVSSALIIVIICVLVITATVRPLESRSVASNLPESALDNLDLIAVPVDAPDPISYPPTTIVNKYIRSVYPGRTLTNLYLTTYRAGGLSTDSWSDCAMAGQDNCDNIILDIKRSGILQATQWTMTRIAGLSDVYRLSGTNRTNNKTMYMALQKGWNGSPAKYPARKAVQSDCVSAGYGNDCYDASSNTYEPGSSIASGRTPPIYYFKFIPKADSNNNIVYTIQAMNNLIEPLDLYLTWTSKGNDCVNTETCKNAIFVKKTVYDADPVYWIVSDS